MHLDHAGDCCICAQPATALWHGSSAIAVCAACAVEVLPALMADAIYLVPRDAADAAAKRAWSAAEAAYWRAVALRALREAAR